MSKPDMTTEEEDEKYDFLYFLLFILVACRLMKLHVSPTRRGEGIHPSEM